MTNLLRYSGIVLLPMMLGLSGCNTFEGFGKDMEATGEAIGKAAEDTGDAIDKAVSD